MKETSNNNVTASPSLQKGATSNKSSSEKNTAAENSAANSMNIPSKSTFEKYVAENSAVNPVNIPSKSTSEKDIVAEKERQKKLKAERDAAAYKKKYFEFYDDVKHSYREDW